MLSGVIGIQSDPDCYVFLPYLPQFKMADVNVKYSLYIEKYIGTG